MDTEQLEHFRRRLLELKAQLEAMAQSSAEDVQPVELDQARVGRLSRMDAMQGQAMAQETARRRERQLAAIEGAFRRMSGGEYGYCFSCGEEIDLRRLQADPSSTRCIGCADKS